ncbi:UNVERIFIED_CONTAM: hypothetical protein K2H54_026305 [Gekko kuhli]
MALYWGNLGMTDGPVCALQVCCEEKTRTKAAQSFLEKSLDKKCDTTNKSGQKAEVSRPQHCANYISRRLIRILKNISYFTCQYELETLYIKADFILNLRLVPFQKYQC